jgi:hypothetical protein
MEAPEGMEEVEVIDIVEMRVSPDGTMGLMTVLFAIPQDPEMVEDELQSIIAEG